MRCSIGWTLLLAASTAAAQQPARDQVLSGLESPSAQTRAAALKRLARSSLRGRRVADQLIAHLEGEAELGLRLEVLRQLPILHKGPGTVAALSAALAHEDPRVRLAGARGLRRVSERVSRAIPELLTATDDSDPSVRCHAILALGEADTRADATAVPRLRSIARDAQRSAAERACALRSLGQLRPRGPSVELLLGAAKGPAPALRAAAVAGLSGVRGRDRARALTPVADALTDADPNVRRQALSTLRRLGPAVARAVPQLRKALGDDALLCSVAEILAGLGADGAPAIPELVARLDGAPAPVRASLCNALGRFRKHGRAAASALAERVRVDPAPRVRSQALFALGSILRGTRRLPASVLKAVADADHHVRARACSTLGDIGGEGAEEALTKALDDPEHLVRYWAATALSQLWPERDSAALRRAAVDDEALVRRGAFRALGSVRKPSDEALDLLAAALSDRGQDPTARQLAAGAIGRAPRTTPAALAALDRALKEPALRLLAAEANARHRRDDALGIGVLLKALEEEERDPRMQALFVLRRLAPQRRDVLRAVRSVVRSDPEPHARMAACRVLIALGRSDLTRLALPDLRAAYRSDESPRVREAVRRALKALQPR